VGGRRHKIKISSLTAQINNNSVTLHFISTLIISTNANIKVVLRPESELPRQLKKKWSTQHRIMRAWRAGLQIKQEAVCQSNAGRPACTSPSAESIVSGGGGEKFDERLLQTAHLMALLNANSVKWLCCVCKCLMRAEPVAAPEA
jgi:hypothetical protein